MDKKITKTRRYKLALHKTYFSTGQALISEWKIQYLVAGLVIVDINASWWLLILLAVCSYALGRAWFKWMQIYAAEVGNQFNMFQKQLREMHKIKT